MLHILKPNLTIDNSYSLHVQTSYLFLKRAPEDFGRWTKYLVCAAILSRSTFEYHKSLRLFSFPFWIFEYQIQTWWGLFWFFHSAWPRRIAKISFRLNPYIWNLKFEPLHLKPQIWILAFESLHLNPFIWIRTLGTLHLKPYI